MIFSESKVRKAGIYGGLALGALSTVLVAEDRTPDLRLMPWGMGGLVLGLCVSAGSYFLLPRRNRPWR